MKSGTFKIRFAGQVLVFGLMCGLAGCHRQTPEMAVRQFFSELAVGRYQEAYEASAFRFRALQSRERFGRAVRELGLEEFSAGQWAAVRVGENRAELEGVHENAAGVRTRLRVELLREAGAWRVAGVRKGGVPGGGEDLFSSIGRGRELNPFVGRAVPEEAELRAMVGNELVRLGAAFRAGSFEEFHRGISNAWREQVTPLTLQHAFGQVWETGYDFSKLNRLRPAYDPVPYVNTNGVLVVDGYYPSRPARLFFGMRFVSEPEGWRLLGLEIQLR